MKVTELHVAGQGAWPELAVERLSPELNVVYGPPRTGKSTIAQLAAQLLYGRTGSPWRRQFGQETPLAEGSLTVDAPQGRYVLRRRRDGSPQGRLMVAAANGAPVDSRTIRTLLCGVSPRLLADLFAVDFAQPPRAQLLLEGEFARQFTQAITREGEAAPAAHAVEPCHFAHGDRRQVDELIRRRDEVVRQIEEQMSGQLRESASLEQELREVDAALGERRQAVEKLAVRLRAVEANLAEIEARLRLFSLESAVRGGPTIDADLHQRHLEAVEVEIARCRQTLADLQSRQAEVRRELAEVQPDGTADSGSLLAVQRATVSVMERLLDDLDAEVAQLARAPEPGRRVGADEHVRLAPVADMLRQQVYALCGQLTEQQRAARRDRLTVESRQLDRAQADLGERLDHLLARRQTLVHEAELSARPVVMLAQPPVDRHCQCQRHEEFTRRSESMVLSRTDRTQREDDLRRRRLEAERQRDALRDGAQALDREIEELAVRWQRLQLQRAKGARSPLDELRIELDRLEVEINRALLKPNSLLAEPPVAPHLRLWKASDVLAQLTGGQLTQIRLSREGRTAVVVDSTGRTCVVEQLSAAQQDQLYLALTLALAASLASRGVDLPLLLDEPFLRQEPADAATMAGVLAEYCRDGRQAFVFTEDREAARRLASLGVAVHDIDQLRRGHAAPAETAVTPELEPVVRVVRAPVDDPVPALRLAGAPVAATDDRDVYYLAPSDSLAEFPVLGRDTAAIFSALGVRTVEDLLAADADAVARALRRPEASSATVRLWQTHMSLMCFVPGVSLVDAQVLAACDVTSPESMFSIDAGLLADAVVRFLASDRGRRFASSSSRFSRDRLAELQKLSRRHRDRWAEASRRYAWIDRPATPGPIPPERRPRKLRTPAVRAQRSVKPKPTKPAALRFLLDRTSPVVDAPSIGRVAAERLASVGIRTVADLLSANADSAAQELGIRSMTASVIARWQSEARLACRIPELRSVGAQLLAACGFTEAEQVAGADPEQLVQLVHDCCRTAAGRRLIRDGRPPSRQRITGWIRQAAHRRPLEAA